MAYRITNNSSITSQRVIPLWCVGSNGTTPATGEAGGQPTWMLGGVYYGSTTNTLSAWSANAGEYFVVLAKSEASVVGQGVVRYSSGNALETSTPFEIVAIDSYDSVRFGLTAIPNAVAAAAGGLLTFGTGAGQLNPSSGSVAIIVGDYGSTVTMGVSGIKGASYSGVTIQGLSNAATVVTAGTVSDKTGYTVTTILPGTLSGVSVEVKTGGIQVASIGAGLYSGVSVEVKSGGIQTTSIGAGNYSGVSYSITTTGAQAIADTVLLRSLAAGTDGGRTVQDALRPLRNRIIISGSAMTVYTEDDVTSAWTASVTTTSDTAISQINPAGGSA